MRDLKRFNREPRVGDKFVIAESFNSGTRTVTAVGKTNYLYLLKGSEYIGYIKAFKVNAIEVDSEAATVKDCWGYVRFGRFWRMPAEADARAVVALNEDTHTLAQIVDGMIVDEHGVRLRGAAA